MIAPIKIDCTGLDIAALKADPRNKGLFQGDTLILPQFAGWYIPDPIVYEPRAEIRAQGNRVVYGDLIYRFEAKSEGARARTIEAVLELLTNPVTLQDYCNLGGNGTLQTDGEGIQYKERVGRLTWQLAQSPMDTGTTIAFQDGLTITFEEG